MPSVIFVDTFLRMVGSLLLHSSELSSSDPQLKTTTCCGHKLDGLVFPKDSPWDLGQVTETASP
uniref:Secreted protein n=1 Tax=Heterorhabditis bacteriophora TaxID=37862 RepID=A0A1I7WLT4_HETBA